MNILPSTGFMKVRSYKLTVKYAAYKVSAGYKVKIEQDEEGIYIVRFCPK